jgi:tRNA (cytidine/uridine-2'-O-)-methyltransferase
MFNIVLVEPQIPQNTGNIGRVCVATNSTLHLIEPLGFAIDEKSVKRAGLDYWDKLDLKVWKSLDHFYSENPFSDRHFFATTKTEQKYFDVEYKNGDYIYFGREDKGLSMDILSKNYDGGVTIPMVGDTRSLNLSNSVSIILYEAIKQNFKEFTLNYG